MREDCFAYSKNYANRCGALIGEVNCNTCSFFKTWDDYKKGVYFDEKDLIKRKTKRSVYKGR